MTGYRTVKEIVKHIDELNKAYPEQEKFINELFNCAIYDVYDADDAKAYIHGINSAMDELFDIIENENFDDRNITDKEYSEIITDIKRIAENIDSAIIEYVGYLIDDYHLYE